MKRLLVLVTAMTIIGGGAIPASATLEPPPPPVPNGWTATPSQSGPFNNTNPCTGEPSAHLVKRWNYTKEHTGGVTERLYHYITTSDGWSTNGWFRGRTYTEISPGGGYIQTTVYNVPLFEDEGSGVMFGRTTRTIVVLADGTTIVENVSPFELSCAGK